MYIREYEPADCSEIAALFYQTVHEVNKQDYTSEQINAWATGKVDLAAWNQSFLEHYTLVAVENGKIAGFGDIDETGYLDRLYVHKEHQREGIAAALCSRLEAHVQGNILTHASITAKLFFQKRGYKVLREQQVERMFARSVGEQRLAVFYIGEREALDALALQHEPRVSGDVYPRADAGQGAAQRQRFQRFWRGLRRAFLFCLRRGAHVGAEGVLLREFVYAAGASRVRERRGAARDGARGGDVRVERGGHQRRLEGGAEAVTREYAAGEERG